VAFRGLKASAPSVKDQWISVAFRGLKAPAPSVEEQWISDIAGE